MKADCYDCQYRGEIPGDAHSRCLHPELGKQNDNPFGVMVDMVRGKYNAAAQKLNIKGNPHGIRNGWFSWPANFDPVWLESCEGFNQKEKTS